MGVFIVAEELREVPLARRQGNVQAYTTKLWGVSEMKGYSHLSISDNKLEELDTIVLMIM